MLGKTYSFIVYYNTSENINYNMVGAASVMMIFTMHEKLYIDLNSPRGFVPPQIQSTTYHQHGFLKIYPYDVTSCLYP